MDLSEIKKGKWPRHPWETVRAWSIGKILRQNSILPERILDVGCGDGFLSNYLYTILSPKHFTGLDIHFDEELIKEFFEKYPHITPINSYLKLTENKFDFIVAADVLEHLEDDSAFLRNLVDKYLCSAGKILLTVPAFERIFSSHDIFLGHHRRYCFASLSELVRSSGLNMVTGGYLFFSLLPPRFVSSFLEKKSRKYPVTFCGVGNWRHGLLMTKIVETILKFDSLVLIGLAKAGLRLPGLSVWILCEKKL